LSGDSGLEKRLLVLMGARLALSLVSLGIAVALEAAGWSYSPSEWRGFYGTVIFAFVATIGYGLILRHVRRVKRFVVLNIATDIAIVSALVHLSGGADSPFAFLYVVIGVYGAILLERKGALICAVAGALVYGSVILVGQQEWLPQHEIGPRDPAPVLLSMWVVNAAGVVLVAWLASLLSAELRRAGEALEQRTSDLSRLQTLHERTVESLKSGLLTTDLDGQITSFNSEAERITSQDRTGVLGTDVEAILPGLRDQLVADFDSAAVGGSSTRGRMAYRGRDDILRYLGIGTYVLQDGETGGGGGHVVIFQDVTDVVEMEANLRQSERLAAIGELSASIAHEIRNPLAAISGSIEMLQGGRAGSAESADSERLMKIVMREVDRLNHLISDFLNYARPRPSKPETFPLQEIISGVLEMFDAARPEAIEIAFEVEDDLTVFADADQLRQLLWNLILNASESMPDGGCLRVSARSLKEGDSQGDSSAGRKGHGEEEGKARQLEIAVADDGSGIPQEKLDRIFDPFFTTKQNGSGLGLATVHRIVQNHGGSVRLESELGVGTTVRIRLPRTGETV
jgi:two-component system sensor histidine kinase PilS (NtrC family)